MNLVNYNDRAYWERLSRQQQIETLPQPSKTIYDADFEERLRDVIKNCETALEMLSDMRPIGEDTSAERIHEKQMDIGNWTIIPRFR